MGRTVLKGARPAASSTTSSESEFIWLSVRNAARSSANGVTSIAIVGISSRPTETKLAIASRERVTMSISGSTCVIMTSAVVTASVITVIQNTLPNT